MKRYILTAIMSLMLFAGTAFASESGQSPQTKEKSAIEKYIQKVARIKSDEIDYSYISTNMIKQIFAMLGNDAKNMPAPFTTIKSMYRFVTTGDEGYKQLVKAMQQFLQEDETVMGMQLMALNRESGTQTVIYSDRNNLLLVEDDGDDELSVVFIAGLTYDAFKVLSKGGFNIDF